MIGRGKQIEDAVDWRPSPRCLLVIEEISEDGRGILFTANYLIAEKLSEYGPVYEVDQTDVPPAFGFVDKWQLIISSYYSPAEVLSYIRELGENLNNSLREKNNV